MKDELLLSDEDIKGVFLGYYTEQWNDATAIEVLDETISSFEYSGHIAQAQLNKIPHLDRWLELLELAGGDIERIVVVDIDQSLPEGIYTYHCQGDALNQLLTAMKHNGWKKVTE